MRDLFVRELQTMLGVELRLEKEAHVANLRRVFTLIGEPDVERDPPPLPVVADGGEIAKLAADVRTAHLEVGAYVFLVHAAEALEVDPEAVRLLRLNMEQDAYAAEQAEHALVQLLAESVTAPR